MSEEKTIKTFIDSYGKEYRITRLDLLNLQKVKLVELIIEMVDDGLRWKRSAERNLEALSIFSKSRIDS